MIHPNVQTAARAGWDQHVMTFAYMGLKYRWTVETVCVKHVILVVAVTQSVPVMELALKENVNVTFLMAGRAHCANFLGVQD